MGDWQDITSAPSDGSRFLVWIAGGGDYELGVAWKDPRDPEVWQFMNLPLLGVRRDHLWGTRHRQIRWMPFPDTSASVAQEQP
jgi:hypothetical protein